MVLGRAAGCFDDTSLGDLKCAFDDAWFLVEADTSPDRREAVRDAIATAILDLAISGHREKGRLVLHAIRHARAVLAEPAAPPTAA